MVGLLLSGAANAAIYYVDFAGGNNAADGLSTSTAWKHAPGDAAATGRPASTTLRAGDVVRFRGGVRYRSTIRVQASGTAAAPIVFDGSGWGTTRAVFDGSDAAIGQRACSSQADCLGAANWASMQTFQVPADRRWSHWVFASDRPYLIAQYPAVTTSYDYDDINKYLAVPLSQLNSLRLGRVAMTGLPQTLAGGDAVLVVWSKPNVLKWADSFSVDPGGISFVASAYVPYDDRSNRVSVMNTPAQVLNAGQFALAPSKGVGIALPRVAGARFAIGTGRNAFLLSGSSNIVIRGFTFTNFAGKRDDVRSGVPILNTTYVDNVRIEQNIFRSIVLSNGQGVSNFSGVTNLSITGNTISQSPFSSGFRVANTAGPVNISCNRISDIGRTGILLQNVKVGTVRANYLTGIRGIHGNGISLYLDNRQLQVTDNVVVNSVRPMTLLGANGTNFFADGTPASMTIARNTLVSISRDSAALISWGGGVRNATISDNIMAGLVQALRLNANDGAMAVDNNKMVGTLVVAGGTFSYSSTGNTFYVPGGNGATLTQQASAATVPAGVCG